MTRLPTKTYGNCLLGLHCSQNDPIQSRIPAGQRVVAGRQQRHCQQVIHRLLLTSSAIRGPVRSFGDDLSYPDQQWRAQPVDCSQIPTRSAQVINSNCARKRLARCATSLCIFCNKKSRKAVWRLRDAVHGNSGCPPGASLARADQNVLGPIATPHQHIHWATFL